METIYCAEHPNYLASTCPMCQAKVGWKPEMKRLIDECPFPLSDETKNNIQSLLQTIATLRESFNGLQKELFIKSAQVEALKKERDELLAENNYLKNV